MDAPQLTEALLGAAQAQMFPGNIVREMRDFVLQLVHCIQGHLLAVPQDQATLWIVTLVFVTTMVLQCAVQTHVQHLQQQPQQHHQQLHLPHHQQQLLLQLPLQPLLQQQLHQAAAVVHV